MTTYLTQSSFDLEVTTIISAATRAYFRERLRNRLHQLFLRAFIREAPKRRDFAQRIGKRPEQITRLLGAPGNWTIDTMADMFLGLGLELDFVCDEVPGTRWPSHLALSGTSVQNQPATVTEITRLARAIPTTVRHELLPVPTTARSPQMGDSVVRVPTAT